MACLGFWPCISLASLADHREALACPSVVAETLYLSIEAALLAKCVRTPPQRAAVLRASPPSAGGAPAVPAGGHRTVPTGAGRKHQLPLGGRGGPSPVVHLQGEEVLMLKWEDSRFKLLLLLQDSNES